MAPTYTTVEKIFIVTNFIQTENAAEVGRRFTAQFGKPAPVRKTIQRIRVKFENRGSVENVRPPGRQRTVRVNANHHVSVTNLQISKQLLMFRAFVSI